MYGFKKGRLHSGVIRTDVYPPTTLLRAPLSLYLDMRMAGQALQVVRQ